jgi:translation initiation factor 2-alpha kinase 4
MLLKKTHLDPRDSKYLGRIFKEMYSLSSLHHQYAARYFATWFKDEDDSGYKDSDDESYMMTKMGMSAPINDSMTFCPHTIAPRLKAKLLLHSIR